MRDRVRREVLQALEQSTLSSSGLRPGPPPAAGANGLNLMVLFTGRTAPSSDFLSQAAELRQRGHALSAAFSHSFQQFFNPDDVLRTLPPGTAHIATQDEREWQPVLAASHALIVPLLSENSAAKVAAGIDDSLTTNVLLAHLRAGKPVIACPDLARMASALREKLSHAAPALAHTAERNYHTLQQMGVQFVPVVEVAAAVARAFHSEPNETPRRLAKTRPSPKREFITAEDVIAAAKAGLTTLTHARDAIITAEARDQAARLGLSLEGV